MDTLAIEQDGISDGRRSGIFEPVNGEVELPLRMRCLNSIPALVVAALLNRLKSSITFVLALMFDRLSEKGLVRAHVALCPEHEVHRLAGSIHCPVQISPFATNLRVRFVNTP